MSSGDLFRPLKAPTRLCLEVTARCQNRCLHCFNYWREPQSAEQCFGCQDMSAETADIVMRKAAAAEVFELVVSGGEPFLNFPVTARIISAAQEAGLIYSINSNLLCVDEEKARWLVENKVPVLTSLLGPNAEVHDAVTGNHGSFAATVRGYLCCRKAGFSPTVNMVLTRRNHHLVREVAVFIAEELGTKRFSVTKGLQPVSCRDFAAQNISRDDVVRAFNDALWARARYGLEVSTSNVVPLCSLDGVEDPLAFSGGPCPCGFSQMVIGCDGSVRPCTLFDLTEGNLVTEDLCVVWERMNRWRKLEVMPTDCRSCELLTRCGGGCRYLGWLEDTSDGYRDTRMDRESVPKLLSTVGPEKLADVQATRRLRVQRYRLRREEFGGVALIQATGRRECFSPPAMEMIESLKPGELYETERVLRTHPAEFLTGLAVRGLIEFLPEDGPAEETVSSTKVPCV